MNKFRFTEIEFLEAIRTSKNHDEASKKLGYKNTRICTKSKTRYGLLMRKLNPDTSHFSSLSKRKDRKYNKIDNSIDVEIELLFNTTKRSAIYNNRKFEISLEYFKSLVTSCCHYCGSEGDWKTRTTFKNRIFSRKFCGIDRVNSNIDYFEGNLVPCCFTCNRMKSNSNINDFLDHVRKIFSFSLVN